MYFVYVLTSDGKDKFLDMTYLSASMIRYIHPDARITILCDETSYQPVINSRHALLKTVDDFLSCPTPDFPASYRNRYVKCRMRQLVKGDFLYLDSDTLARKSLESLFEIKESFAAANNHNRELPENFGWNDKDVYDKIGWTYPEKHYLNGGLQFWRDADAAYRLAELYIEKWTILQQAGFHFDQPALNAAIVEWKGEYRVLDNKFNAQIRADLRSGIDASLWHYYQTNTTSPVYKEYFTIGLNKINATGKINRRFKSKVVHSRLPYEINSKKTEARLINTILLKGNSIKEKDIINCGKSGIREMANKLFQRIIAKIKRLLLK
jgi:lipopolysaccharide biosynthesis glycosyltransferase